MFKERWTSIPGFTKYEVSDIGRVRNKKTGKIIKAIIGKRKNSRGSAGYLEMALMSDEGKSKKVRVHKIVACAWLGHCPADCVVNHIDGVKTNAMKWNFEIITYGDNLKHAYETGLRPRVAPRRAVAA